MPARRQQLASIGAPGVDMFDQDLSALKQALVDLDGDGKPDIAVPIEQITFPSQGRQPSHGPGDQMPPDAATGAQLMDGPQNALAGGRQAPPPGMPPGMLPGANALSMARPAGPPIPPAPGGGISPQDVAALLQALMRAGPDALGAVAQMILSAAQGRPLDADIRALGVDPALLARILQAAGGNGGPPGVSNALAARVPPSGSTMGGSQAPPPTGPMNPNALARYPRAPGL